MKIKNDMKFTQTEIAERIAKEAHAGQFRRDGVTPYWTHPKAVAEALRDAGEPDMVVATGWLHDVIEDNPEWTQQRLLENGISQQVVNAVALLTKDKGAHYGLYIQYVRSNITARKVKVQDILHNLCSNPKPESVAKYAKALVTLLT